MDTARGEGVLLGGKRPRRKFSDEFKRDAVEIVRSSGKPIRQVANELGIYDSTLGNWVRQDEINRGEREGLTSDERERFREPGAGVELVMLYRFVDAEAAEGFPVRMVCLVVGVSPSAYYAHKQRPQSGGTYGSRRVCAELRRRGRVVNHKRVERLMKCHHMAGFVPRKRRVTTTADTSHRIPDLLRGDFTTSAPDEAWVGSSKSYAASLTGSPTRRIRDHHLRRRRPWAGSCGAGCPEAPGPA